MIELISYLRRMFTEIVTSTEWMDSETKTAALSKVLIDDYALPLYVHISFKGIALYHDLSLVTRKPVFGIFDQLRLKAACSASETS